MVDEGDIVLHPALVALLWASLGGLLSVLISLAGTPPTRQRNRRGSVTGLFAIAFGVLWLLIWRLHAPVNIVVAAAFAVVAVPLAWEDALTQRLPNRLIAILAALVGSAVAAGTLLTADLEPLVRAGVGAAGCLVFFALIYVLVPSGLGGGDVKLAAPWAAVLAWFSWPALFSGLLVAWLAAALIHLGLRTVSRPLSTVPLGPCLIGANIVVMLIAGADGVMTG
ncbi:hypothetical protein GCM10027597_18520 [Saccharopolyspora tripterygii]